MHNRSKEQICSCSLSSDLFSISLFSKSHLITYFVHEFALLTHISQFTALENEATPNVILNLRDTNCIEQSGTEYIIDGMHVKFKVTYQMHIHNKSLL